MCKYSETVRIQLAPFGTGGYLRVERLTPAAATAASASFEREHHRGTDAAWTAAVRASVARLSE